MFDKHLPFIEEAGKEGRPDPLPAGDLQRPVLLPEPGHALVRRRRAGARADDRSPDRRSRKKYQMVMIVPVYEREQAGVYYNTAAVIDADGTLPRQVPQEPHPAHLGLLGEVLLQARQPRLPGVRDRATARSASTSATTATSPRARACSGSNGAEIVFNPSATVAGLSQYLWKLEQPAHAVANGYFMGCINRVGTEAPWNIGKFYGHSYFVDPAGADSSPRASEDEDELVVAEMDLDLIEEVRRSLAVLPRPPPRDLRRHDGASSVMELSESRLETRFEDKKPAFDASEATREANRCLYCYRRALHHRLSDVDRHPDVHPEDRDRQPARLGAHDPRKRTSSAPVAPPCAPSRSCARAPASITTRSRSPSRSDDCSATPWRRPGLRICSIGPSPRAGASRSWAPVPRASPVRGALALRGHRAVLFEKERSPGGLNMTGVAPYKLRAEGCLCRGRVHSGARRRHPYGGRGGKRRLAPRSCSPTMTPSFSASGSGRTRSRGAGRRRTRRLGALAWIRRMKLDPARRLDGVRRAVVVGGGNTALDAAQRARGARGDRG